MIEKMTFLNISGPKEDIDRMVDTYLGKYPIHLENALSELSEVRDLYPYIQANPYKEWLEKAESFRTRLPEGAAPGRTLAPEEAQDVLREVEGELRQNEQHLPELKAELAESQDLLQKISPFRTLPAEVGEIIKFRFIKIRFGRIPRDLYKKFDRYVYDDLNMIFLKTEMDDEYVWGICFIAPGHLEKTEAVLSSLHFERVWVPDEYNGMPDQAYEKLNVKCRKLTDEIGKIREKSDELLSRRADEILAAREVLKRRTQQFDVRKYAACTKEREVVYYILCGWMGEEDAKSFIAETEKDPDVTCIEEDAQQITYETPPTRLKNPGLFKPFEMYIKMYGLPSYKELDPTIFVAVTYSFLFGAMFGDLGQGLLLLIGGFILYKKKHMALAGIISTAGFFSSIFGIMFGSIFGFEDIIPALWLRPREAMSQLPVIGNLNTVFVVAVAFGMFLILVTMVLHIINAVKAGSVGDKWFDTNGVAGFIFYIMICLSIVLIMTGRTLPGAVLMVLLIGLPLLAIALKEPLENIIEKRKPVIEGGVGMYITQTFFELFETMLSFFSNTLSFVRVGAFAVSHAAMMEVVLMLAGAENGGSPNWIVVVLGNLFVCGLEGLIVGIQVLRLEYYEMFSRFYKGDGREFRPFLVRQEEKSS